MLEQRWPLLIADALTEIYTEPDSSRFLQWMMENVARYLDDDVFPIENQAIRSTGLQLGIAIWSATPQPDHGFECTPIQLPNANHFCPCGSGKQYKNCCAHAPVVPELDSVEVFSIAAAQMPQKLVFEIAEKQPPSAYMLFL
ncbi:MAG TPA: SEC-C metal-binding domain-containing protein, partial [Pseudomonadales bacterium]|nr:SEC-C metal-binding domain-containing protein [Pseudomonadales bacterium]